MKQKIFYIPALILALQSCAANEQTGEMEPGWLFWLFLGLLLGGVFIGALYNFLRKKKPEDAPTLAEKEIEAYEETLNKKLEEENSEEPKEGPQDTDAGDSKEADKEDKEENQ